MSGSFLKVQGLSKSFHQNRSDLKVLEGLSLEMNEGESLSIVGQSGVGKSTLLNCLGLLDSFDSGEIWFGGEKVASGGLKTIHEKAAVQRRKSIGFVFQFHYLMSELSALENVLVPLLLGGMDRAESERRAAEMLDQVGLRARATHRPSELSGGEQQRVAIARALVSQPKIILADEPTGNLDPKTADHVFNVLKEQTLRLKAILIMATHNMELARFLDRKATLVAGKLQ